MKNISIRSVLGIGVLGIDMADDAVRVVELRRRRGNLACRNSGSGCTRVALAMPATALITHVIRLPAGLPEEQLEILVELEAAQYMPFALEDASLDFFILGPAPPLAGQTGREIDVLLVAARRASVQRRLDAAMAAGLTPIVMDSEALALQAALAQGGWQALPDGGLAFQLAWGLALHRYAR